MDSHTPQNSTVGVTETPYEIRPFIVLQWLFFAGCGLYALLFLYHGTALLLYPFDVDNSEAYLVYQGARLAQGEFLYPSLDEFPYLVDNYPPFYPLLEAVGFLFTGPNFHWPRFLSLAAACLTALLVGWWTFLRTNNRMAALLSGMVFLSFYHVYDWCALARVDTVGLCLSLCGVVVFERTRSWKWAIPWLLLAVFTKQSLFAAPLAVFFVLFASNRNEAFRYLAALAIGTGIFFSILFVLSNGRVVNHLFFYNANAYRLNDLFYYVRYWLIFYTVWGSIPVLTLFFEGKWAFLPSNRIDEKSISPLLFWYTLFAIVEAALCGKIGSAPNYLLSLVAATAVGLGSLYGHIIALYNSQKNDNTRAVFLFFLAAGLFQLGATAHWPNSGRNLHPSPTDWSYTPSKVDTHAGIKLKQMLETTDGPVFTDRAGVALMAGHAPVCQPFICTQLSNDGRWDQENLLARIAAGQFPIAVLHFDLSDPHWDRERFTAEMIESLRAQYILDRRLGPYFLYTIQH